MSNTKETTQKGKIIIFTAPSGSGKTTVVRHVLSKFDFLDFSISATMREKRPHEKEGVDYYFLSVDEFKKNTKSWQHGSFLGFFDSLISKLCNLCFQAYCK